MKFKTGDMIKFKDSWCDVTAGKEYELFRDDNILKFRDDTGDHLNFYDIINNCRTGIASGKKLIETKDDKKMEFKEGKIYKSNQSPDLYRYICEHINRDYLIFEIVNGESAGELIEVSKLYAEAAFELQKDGEDHAPDVPVFVKATLDEAITAFKEGNKSDFYMYNPKKGICTPLVNETNILMLTTWTILKKVGE